MNNKNLIDSSVFISVFLEEDDSKICHNIIQDAGNGYEGFVSCLTLGEIIKKIKEDTMTKKRRKYLIHKVIEYLEKFKVLHIDNEIIEIFHKLEEQRLWPKTHDKLLIATGIYNNCTAFIVKDRELAKEKNVAIDSENEEKRKIKILHVTDKYLSKYHH